MEEGVLVMVMFSPFFVCCGATFPPFFYRFRIPKRDKKGHELTEIWAKFAFFVKICVFSTSMQTFWKFFYLFWKL